MEEDPKKRMYADLPKHFGGIGSGNDGKIEFKDPKADEDKLKFTWREIISAIWEYWWAKAIVWIVVPLVVLNLWIFRYDDFSNGCHMKISISLLEWNNLQIKKALGFIRDNSDSDYKKVCAYVDSISPDLPCGGSGGGCFHPGREKEIEVSTLGHASKPELTAAIIVHETCHSVQKEENRPFDEKECYKEANRFLKAVGKWDKVPPNWRAFE